MQDSALFTSAGTVAPKDISVDVADVLLVGGQGFVGVPSWHCSPQTKPAPMKFALPVPAWQVNGQDASVGTYAWKLMQFMTAGGGVLVGAQTMSWVNGGKALVDHPANKLLRPLVSSLHFTSLHKLYKLYSPRSQKGAQEKKQAV